MGRCSRVTGEEGLYCLFADRGTCCMSRYELYGSAEGARLTVALVGQRLQGKTSFKGRSAAKGKLVFEVSAPGLLGVCGC